MALREILRDRAARRGGTAQVNCGELGLLTVEALSPADCAALSDSRALLYAACRELQIIGEELRAEGKIFRPDEIAAYVTEDEADAAARTILELSGWSGDAAAVTDSDSGMMTALSEIRHDSVQGAEALPAGDNGLWAADAEIRLSSVQPFGGTLSEYGQVSREFSAGSGNLTLGSAEGQESQFVGDLSVRTAQILASNPGEATTAKFQRDETAIGLHETESEYGGNERGLLHEIESELVRRPAVNLHETTSDFGGRRGILLHETESESADIVHEIKSELEQALHEIKSEVAEILHETKSEAAEEAVRRLAEGLMRAAAVR